ncbi:hypothetical protein [Streptococcus fryi]
MPVTDFKPNDRTTDVWKVSKTGHQPIWVQEAFKKNYFQWVENHLKVLVSGINPNWWKQSGRYLGYGMYVQANMGDIIDRTNCQILTNSEFTKKYGSTD